MVSAWLLVIVAIAQGMARDPPIIVVPLVELKNTTVRFNEFDCFNVQDFICMEKEKGIMECEVSPGVWKEYENEAQRVLDFGTFWLRLVSRGCFGVSQSSVHFFGFLLRLCLPLCCECFGS